MGFTLQFCVCSISPEPFEQFCPRFFQWGAYSICLIHTATPSRPIHTYIHTKNGFSAVSFEYIGILKSYFIHRYIIIRYRPRLILDKILLLLTKEAQLNFGYSLKKLLLSYWEIRDKNISEDFNYKKIHRRYIYDMAVLYCGVVLPY